MLLKLHLYVMLSFGDSFYPADTDISCGFALLNDVQAALILVSLRTLTKKVRLDRRLWLGILSEYISVSLVRGNPGAQINKVRLLLFISC